MKEWLKEFLAAYRKTWLSVEDNEFISDYLRDHPLPLPTDEEIGVEAIKRRTLANTGFQYTHDAKWFAKGAKWMRDQIRKEQL